MARIKLSEDEKLKRKLERRARKKAERAEKKAAKKEAATLTKKSGRKKVKSSVVEVAADDKAGMRKMSMLVEAGKARHYGWNMGNYMYELKA